MKKNEIIETTSTYRRLKDEIIAEHIFTEVEINKMPRKINDDIEKYIMFYKKNPQMILISRELEIILINKIDIMHHHQLIMLGNNELRVAFIFGIPVLTTPVLNGLEFEIR